MEVILNITNRLVSDYPSLQAHYIVSQNSIVVSHYIDSEVIWDIKFNCNDLSDYKIRIYVINKLNKAILIDNVIYYVTNTNKVNEVINHVKYMTNNFNHIVIKL